MQRKINNPTLMSPAARHLLKASFSIARNSFENTVHKSFPTQRPKHNGYMEIGSDYFLIQPQDVVQRETYSLPLQGLKLLGEHSPEFLIDPPT